MKRLIFFLISIIISITQLPINISAKSRFARIEKMTNIYKTISLDNSFENIICLAEESYFVEIIVEYEQCYRVNYNQVTGFVKKADVKEISNTPLTPYPNNIKLTIGNNCNLRSSPTTQSTTTNIVIPIYTNTENIEFIGRIFGEEAIDFGGNTWYLIKHNNQYGYIYNKYVSSISPIYYNTENVSYTQEDIQSIQNPITHTPSIILIIILSIPIAITLFIFFLPQKTKHKPKRTPKIIEKY